MDEQDKAKYKPLYVTTATEYITSLKESITILKTNPSDLPAIESAYISSHSLKSQSLVMDYKGIGQASGILEFTFRDVKAGKISLEKQMVELLEHGILTLSFAVQSIGDNNGEPDLSSLVRELESGTTIEFSVK